MVEQRDAVGHAVRAAYMYAAMVDVAALDADPLYREAAQRIWEDVVFRKLYLTGGIGARHEGEAFGDAFELPNRTAYAETCASIANVYWSHRLFLLTGDAKYVDVLERTLYNAALAGVSLEGDTVLLPEPAGVGWAVRRSTTAPPPASRGSIPRAVPPTSPASFLRSATTSTRRGRARCS